MALIIDDGQCRDYLRGRKACGGVIMATKTSTTIPIDITRPRKRIRSSNYEGRDHGSIGSLSSIFGVSTTRSSPEHRYFAPQFLPPSTSSIRNRLSDSCKRVSLKSYAVSRWQLAGTILTSEHDSEKNVFVRYTLDDWVTWSDIQATYMDTDTVTGAGRYHFRLDFPFRLPADTKLQMAVASCIPGGVTNWDNNEGANYVFTYKSIVQ